MFVIPRTQAAGFCDDFLKKLRFACFLKETSAIAERYPLFSKETSAIAER